MHRLFLTLLLLATGATAAPASAEDWWHVGATPDFIALVDADSIAGSGDVRTVVLRNYSRDPAVFGETRIEVDCERNRLRYLSLTQLAEDLSVIRSVPTPPRFQDYRYPGPTNNGTYIIRFACGDRTYARNQQIGRLVGTAGDRATLFRLRDAGVPDEIAVPLALGVVDPEQAEIVIRQLSPELREVIRRNGLPRPIPRRP